MPVIVPLIGTSKLYADFVEETTDTTGTGSYNLLGAAAGMRTFGSQFALGDSIAYVCTDDAGNWEAGVGTLTSGGAIYRTLVTASTNSGAAVDWAAGTKRIYCALHAGAIGPRHNVSAGSTAPDSGTNDESQGYGPGSLWITTTAIWMYAGSGNGGWRQIS